MHSLYAWTWAQERNKMETASRKIRTTATSNHLLSEYGMSAVIVVSNAGASFTSHLIL